MKCFYIFCVFNVVITCPGVWYCWSLDIERKKRKTKWIQCSCLSFSQLIKFSVSGPIECRWRCWLYTCIHEFNLIWTFLSSVYSISVGHSYSIIILLCIIIVVFEDSMRFCGWWMPLSVFINSSWSVVEMAVGKYSIHVLCVQCAIHTLIKNVPFHTKRKEKKKNQFT